MTEGRRATRKDVARRAGVSVAVVSYALNGRAPVAPETKRRVLEAVAELGYQPNVTAQALKSGSARTIALIVPDGMNPFFTELALAAESAARERGCALYITTSPDDQATTVSRFREFRARQVDGVLAVPRHSIDPVELDAVGLPWVLFNSSVPVPGVASLGVDLYRGGLEAAGHLLGHGHRGVAFAGVTGEARHRGWLEACAAAGVEPGPAVTASFDREGGDRAGRELLALPELPPAGFAASDMLAGGLRRARHEA
ncbi:MAG: LacI family DNA-binding transcriptional regulator, partial [Nonomuraea sp.]|nr:LacI family DNA-binding transcriptional regulator [Nonomuraea sp.]